MVPTIDDFKEGTKYQMKERFMDGTVKTQEDYDKAKWVDCVFTEGDRPYVERALTGRNADKGLCGIRLLTTILIVMLLSSCTMTKRVVKTQEFKGAAVLVVGAVIVKSIKFKER